MIFGANFSEIKTISGDKTRGFGEWEVPISNLGGQTLSRPTVSAIRIPERGLRWLDAFALRSEHALDWKFKVIKRKDSEPKLGSKGSDRGDRKEPGRIQQIIYSRICIFIK